MGNQEVTDLPAGEQEKRREESVKNTQDQDQVGFYEKIDSIDD